MIYLHVATESVSQMTKVCLNTFPERWHMDFIEFNFPEIVKVDSCDLPFQPRTPVEIIHWCETVLAEAIRSSESDGKDYLISTTSEHICLWILREIGATTDDTLRRVNLNPSQVCFTQFDGTNANIKRASSKGDFLDGWIGGFFRGRETLLFGRRGRDEHDYRPDELIGKDE